MNKFINQFTASEIAIFKTLDQNTQFIVDNDCHSVAFFSPLNINKQDSVNVVKKYNLESPERLIIVKNNLGVSYSSSYLNDKRFNLLGIYNSLFDNDESFGVAYIDECVNYCYFLKNMLEAHTKFDTFLFEDFYNENKSFSKDGLAPTLFTGKFSVAMINMVLEDLKKMQKKGVEWAHFDLVSASPRLDRSNSTPGVFTTEIDLNSSFLKQASTLGHSVVKYKNKELFKVEGAHRFNGPTIASLRVGFFLPKEALKNLEAYRACYLDKSK